MEEKTKNETKIPDFAAMQKFSVPGIHQDATLYLIAKGDFFQLEKLFAKGLLYIEVPFLHQLLLMGHENKIWEYLKHNEWISAGFVKSGGTLVSSAAQDILKWLQAYIGYDEAQRFVLKEKIDKLLPFLNKNVLLKHGEWQALADQKEWDLLAEHQKFDFIPAHHYSAAIALIKAGQEERVIAEKNWLPFTQSAAGRKMLAERGLFNFVYPGSRAHRNDDTLLQLILDNGGADFLCSKKEDQFLLADARRPDAYVKAAEWAALYKYGYYDLIDWHNWYQKWCKEDYSGLIRFAVAQRQWNFLKQHFAPGKYRVELFLQGFYGRWLRSFF